MEFTLGVLLEVDGAPVGVEEWLEEGGDVPASGRRGTHRSTAGSRLVRAGEDALRVTAHAIGREVATVVAGVMNGIDGDPLLGSAGAADRPFDVGDLELKFGVKTVLGAGKMVEAFMTASGETAVEVTVTLHRRTTS
ncbi:hypothetical protein [Dactylosporangium cerinum]|uniref:hypothetical protein n=1 Tax=Dactylosporangium cerinum TaxID=1434730 RepID=UPI0036D295C7